MFHIECGFFIFRVLVIMFVYILALIFFLQLLKLMTAPSPLLHLAILICKRRNATGFSERNGLVPCIASFSEFC